MRLPARRCRLLLLQVAALHVRGRVPVRVVVILWRLLLLLLRPRSGLLRLHVFLICLLLVGIRFRIRDITNGIRLLLMLGLGAGTAIRLHLLPIRLINRLSVLILLKLRRVYVLLLKVGASLDVTDGLTTTEVRRMRLLELKKLSKHLKLLV